MQLVSDYIHPYRSAGGRRAPLILAMQILRLFAVVLAGSLLGRWWSS
jgi:hypothetical protein